MLVKICGLTLAEDAKFAVAHGADFLGIVLSTTSPRRAGETQARALLGHGFTQPVYLVFGYDDVDYIEKTFRTLALPDTRLQIMADHPEIERLLTLAPAERIMPSISAAQKIREADISRWEKHPLVLFDSHRGPHPRSPSPEGEGEPTHPLPPGEGRRSDAGVRPASGLSPERVAGGGTGKIFDHTNIHGIHRPYLLAGGLSPDNVAEIITKVNPPGVDVASGVEQSPGIKDRDKLRRFIENSRRAAQMFHAQQ